MNFKNLNLIGGWIAFAISFFVYANTIEPTTSFWDCGEYIATSNKLEVGHPPGAPTFMMIGRVVSMFSSPDNVAVMINLLSALCSALTILFLFWTISYLAVKFIKDEELNQANLIAIFGSAFVGSMAFTFSDTFWFSAVEGEVYAMSSFCTALVFWAILRWERVADEPHSNRWLIFIWYVIGLSIGVHLLNLLAIPAIVFVYYFKRYETTGKGMLIAFAVSIVLLGFVQLVLIPQIVNISAKFELIFVNNLGMPFHSGSIFFAVVLISALVYGIYITHKNKKVLANSALLSFAVLLIGYTSFGMILIRSNANTPIDENNPENMINLLSYLRREQYGDIPLAYGQTFSAPLDPREPYLDGSPVYYPDEETGRYEIADNKEKSIPNHASEFKMLFPRMWSGKGNHIRAYKAWTNFKGDKIRFQGYGDPEMKVYEKPTMGENIIYFFKYQMWWMWGRYFSWNFIGRQNDIQGHNIDSGKYTEGNTISGVTPIDEFFQGNFDKYPDELKDNKAYNKYYFLPLILGLLGLFFQYRHDPKNALVVFLLFFFTGIAIAVYLNMYPYQPRERDYAFVGSFYAFAIWIGLGVIGLYKELKNKIPATALAGGLTVICTLLVPVIMAKENWDDHDRSGRYTARDIAKDYLDSCAPNAILFTNGDNDTFPLWYVQEVEGYRTDVRVVNLMLLNTDWYIEQMARKAYDGDGIPISMKPDQYRQGTRDFIQYGEDPRLDKNKFYDLKRIVDFISKDESARSLGQQGGDKRNYIPTRNLRIPAPDSATAVKYGLVSPEEASRVTDITWKAKGNYILKSELAVWDLLANNNWERPIYFSITMGEDAFFGLEDYFRQEGFAYRLVPVKNASAGYRSYGTVATEMMYDNLMNKFTWGGLEDTTIYLDENNLRFVTNIRFTFTRLAQDLAQQKDNERAEAVLDKCREIAVNSNTPANAAIIPMAQVYYSIDRPEKAHEVLQVLLERETQFIEYYLSQNRKFLVPQLSKLEQSLGSLQQIVATQKRFDAGSDFTKEIESTVQNYIRQYQGIAQ